jgi:hypothetical protein
MAVSEPAPDVLAASSDQPGYFFLEDLFHHRQPDADGERQQSLLGDDGQIAQRNGDAFGNLEIFNLGLGADAWSGWGCRGAVHHVA